MVGGGGGTLGGTDSAGAWAGSSGALEKITIPVASGQVIEFSIGAGGAGVVPSTQSGGNGMATTITMYGKTLLTTNGCFGSGINGGDGATTTGVSCGGGGMGSVNTSTYGNGGTGTIPGQDGTIYETLGSGEQSRNGGLNNLGQLPLLDSASGMAGAGGGTLAGYGVGSITSTTTRVTNGTYGSGGGGAFGGAPNQLNGRSGGNGYVKINTCKIC